MSSKCRFDPRLLWEYQEDLIDARLREKVELHLGQCEHCRRSLEQDRALFARFRAARPEVAPAVLVTPQLSHQKTRTSSNLKWALSVAGIAALGIVSFGLFRLADVGPARSTVHLGPAPEKEIATTEKTSAVKDGAPAFPGQEPGYDADRPARVQARKESEVSGAAPRPRTSSDLGSQQGLPKTSVPATTPFGPPSPRPAHEKTVTIPEVTEASKPSGLHEGHSSGVAPGVAGAGLRVGSDREGTATIEPSAAKSAVPPPAIGSRTTAFVGVLSANGDLLRWCHTEGEVLTLRPGNDGPDWTIRLTAAKAWNGMPEYLSRKVTLSTNGTVTRVTEELARQAGITIHVLKLHSPPVLRVEFQEARTDVVLANLALAAGFEWSGEPTKVTIRPLDVPESVSSVHPVIPLPLAKGHQQVPRGAGLTLDQEGWPTCAWCDRPNMGPVWRYCPFCGQDLRKKP